jgi:hypothetical protein
VDESALYPASAEFFATWTMDIIDNARFSLHVPMP